MLAADSTGELIRRHLSIAIGDLGFYIKLTPDTPLRTGTGREIDAAELRDNHRATLVTHSLGKELSTRPTGLAHGFLDAALGGGELKYSRLSSVAHGESYSVNSFANIEQINDQQITLSLPRNVAIEYVGYVVVGGAMLGNELIDMFEPPMDERERWHAAKTRALER